MAEIEASMAELEPREAGQSARSPLNRACGFHMGVRRRTALVR